MRIHSLARWNERAATAWKRIREITINRHSSGAQPSSSEVGAGFKRTVKVEWGEDMDQTSVSLGFSDGPYREATLKGRCQRCWGGLIGRRNEAHAMTGIKCRVCGETLEGAEAEKEERRIFAEANTNLLNMRHDWLPNYSEGLFVRKVFPHMERLTEEEITQRTSKKVVAKESTRNRKTLTRNDFPAGSPGWLYFQAKILMAGVENSFNAEEASVVDFPEFDMRGDGSIVVYPFWEGLEVGQRHREYIFMGRMGSIMSVSMISAFACELAMKAISLTCKDEAIRTHDLVDLLNDLPEESRARIDADFGEIEAVMEQGRQTFGNWRYFEQALEGKGMLAMIDIGRARALGKAARVILDEGDMMGLWGRLDLNAKENVRGTEERRNYKQDFQATVTGGEWPPRVFAGGRGRKLPSP